VLRIRCRSARPKERVPSLRRCRASPTGGGAGLPGAVDACAVSVVGRSRRRPLCADGGCWLRRWMAEALLGCGKRSRMTAPRASTCRAELHQAAGRSPRLALPRRRSGAEASLLASKPPRWVPIAEAMSAREGPLGEWTGEWARRGGINPMPSPGGCLPPLPPRWRVGARHAAGIQRRLPWGSVPFGVSTWAIVVPVYLTDTIRSQSFSLSQRFEPARASWLCFAPHPPLGFRSSEPFPLGQP